MPPRYVYWTIIAGGLPTAFRATEREELLPTFRRLKERHPDAELKYFARGRLWASKEEARADADQRQAARATARSPGWRPGGEHRDPSQPYKDAKKSRNLAWRKERFERRERSNPKTGSQDRPSHGTPDRGRYERPPRQHDSQDGKTFGGGASRPRGAFEDRPADRNRFGRPPAGRKPSGWSPGGRKPFGGPPADRKPFGGPPADRRPSGRPPTGQKPFGVEPSDRRPSGGPAGRKPAWGPPSGRKPPGGPPRPYRPAGPPPRDRRRRS